MAGLGFLKAFFGIYEKEEIPCTTTTEAPTTTVEETTTAALSEETITTTAAWTEAPTTTTTTTTRTSTAAWTEKVSTTTAGWSEEPTTMELQWSEWSECKECVDVMRQRTKGNEEESEMCFQQEDMATVLIGGCSDKVAVNENLVYHPEKLDCGISDSPFQSCGEQAGAFLNDSVVICGTEDKSGNL